MLRTDYFTVKSSLRLTCNFLMCLFIASLGNKMRIRIKRNWCQQNDRSIRRKQQQTRSWNEKVNVLLFPILSIHPRVNRQQTLDNRCASEHFTWTVRQDTQRRRVTIAARHKVEFVELVRVKYQSRIPRASYLWRVTAHTLQFLFSTFDLHIAVEP